MIPSISQQQPIHRRSSKFRQPCPRCITWLTESSGICHICHPWRIGHLPTVVFQAPAVVELLATVIMFILVIDSPCHLSWFSQLPVRIWILMDSWSLIIQMTKSQVSMPSLDENNNTGWWYTMVNILLMVVNIWLLYGQWWLITILVGGWAYPSEKYESVSWDDDIPNWMGSHSKFHGSSHHQPELCWLIEASP